MANVIKYVSRSGKEFVFNKDGGYRISGTDHRDYTVGSYKVGGVVVGLYRNIQNMNIDVVISGYDANERRNAFYEAVDSDVMNGTPGRLYDGDFYREGYVVGSKKSNWFNPYYSVETIEFMPTSEYWIREQTKVFSPKLSDGLDFPTDFPFDFAIGASADDISNENYSPSAIRIVVQGPASNPSITIAGNEYQIDTSVAADEYLEIDGLKKTIEIVSPDGTRRNVFSKRHGLQVVGSGSYVFERIPVGSSPIIYSNGLTFSVTVIEQRAEPRWA